MNEFHDARSFVDKYNSFLLASHEFTDGDDLGAMLALGHVLQGFGKKITMVAKGGVPDSLLFLPGSADVRAELPEGGSNAEALITLGCGTLERPGFPELTNWQKPILAIDHHPDSQKFGSVNVWNPKAAANCELVYAMLKDWGVRMEKPIAMALLTGIFTDTGGFRHSNVTAATLDAAAQLLRAGAQIEIISRFTQAHRQMPMLRAWAVALEHARFDPERKIIYTVITDEDLRKIGAKEEDLEGVVELLNTIPEAKFSLLLKQRGDEVKGSLRSESYKGVDVAEIARAFGGGGHKYAAGFKFRGKIEKTPEGWKIT